MSYQSSATAADAESESRERYQRALKYYDEGAYDAALAELHRTMELRPSFKLYYNIAQVRVAMRDYAEALRAFRQYLDGGGDKISSVSRQTTQREIAQIEQRVSMLTVETDIAGAEVLVDDVPQGKTPLPGPLLVNSGLRRVAVRHPSYPGQNEQVTLPGGVPGKIAFTLTPKSSDPSGPTTKAAAPTPAPGTPSTTPAVRAESSPSSTATPTAPIPRNSPSRTQHTQVPWVGWAITGTLTAGAAVAGAMALSTNSELEQARERFGISHDELDSQATRVRTWATACDGLAVAALVAGGVSLWLTFRSSGSESAGAHASPSATTPVTVGVGLHGVSLKAGF